MPLKQKPGKLFYAYRHAAFLLCFVLLYAGYFLTQKYSPSPHMISCPLDQLIPFCEWFIIPYYFWYIYIIVPVVYFLFVSREDFICMSLYLFSGMAVCLLCFYFYPTGIDFRPTVFARDNFAVGLVKLLYAADQPKNVCPSLHCYESAVIHIAIVKSRIFSSKRFIRYLSLCVMILIWISTVFVKQHSVIDLFFSAVLTAVLYWAVYKPVRQKLLPAMPQNAK